MSDPEETSESETFTFVDKRRASDSSEAPDIEVELPSDPANDEDEADSAEPAASIYDIAAYCMGLLITEGFQRMGLIADPKTGKATADLPSARVAIDCVAALVNVLDEPASTLPEPVRREMKRTLNDLRLNYIDRTRN